jgi:hypothetical protein
MNRPLAYRLVAAALVAVLGLFAAGGCRSMLTSWALLTGSMENPPDFPGLKDKKVVVVCRPLVSLQNVSVSRDLAQQLSALLKKQVPKIKVIDQQKVAAWADEHTWEDFREVGKALGADMVVGIELSQFSIYEGQTLYRGKAVVTLKVYDLSKGKNEQMVFEKHMPQSVYPPNAIIPASERLEPEFRREFVCVLADQIGRHFYAHDPQADITLDSQAGLR